MNLRLAILTLLFCSVLSNDLFGSPQYPDVIIVEGDTSNLYAFLLEPLIDHLRPSDEELFGLTFRSGATTNCWRGYQAVYEVRNDSLYLKTIVHCGGVSAWAKGNKEVVDSTLLGAVIQAQNGWFMAWADVKFVVPLPSPLVRWDGVFDRVYEKERSIKVKRGRLTKSGFINNYFDAPGRINRRQEDTIQLHLFRAIECLDWEALDEFDCADAYLVEIRSNGRVQLVGFRDYAPEELDKFWDEKSYKKCFRTLSKAWRKLRFDRVKWHGEPFAEKIQVEFFYSEGKLENWSDY